ncbi:ArnT family glycosyltransferase, partial [Singulisphaera rosea]
MAHRKKAARSSKPPQAPPQEAPEVPDEPFWSTRRLVLAVALLLTSHATLAVMSLVLENPTVDEVVHLPAGLTYWQTGSFRLYHHNPPLIKLVAALPVLGMDGLRVPYDSKMSGWNDEPPNKAAFAHAFQQENAPHYFELFARARLMIPLFSILGGLVVFFWAKSLYGAGGGLLSLSLWIFCPNILAHCRLVTTDVGATALGALATYVFWHYLKRPTWFKAVLAGLCLGIAQLSKFSLILLYGIWPLLGVVHWLSNSARGARFEGMAAGLGRWALMFVLSLFVIDAGYAFEGVGIPLGKYEFVNKTFTRDVPPGMWRPSSPDALLNGAYRYRVNLFRGTWLDSLPVPLPKHYMLGFDDQKLEADGIPERYLDPKSERDEPKGYPVYLDGELRQKSWWYYYFLTLVYKVPEGTWALVLASLVVMVASSRSRSSWFDELTVLIMPVVILFVMSVFTNINIGLRYGLPIFPYLYISAGKLVPWAAGMKDLAQRRAAGVFLGASLAAT